MGEVVAGPSCAMRAVAALAVIVAGAMFFTTPPKANTVLPAKPVVELSPIDTPPPGSEAVEMFAAMGRGDLAVRLMPEKEQQARLELENRTDRPLTVQVPASFGGRFILAAMGVAPGAGPPQSVGGSMVAAWAACSVFHRRRWDAFGSRPHALTSRSPSRAPAWSTKFAALRN